MEDVSVLLKFSMQKQENPVQLVIFQYPTMLTLYVRGWSVEARQEAETAGCLTEPRSPPCQSSW